MCRIIRAVSTTLVLPTSAAVPLGSYGSNICASACSLVKQSQHDVWTTSDAMLAMAAGGPQEHAHLLSGLFLNAGYQVSHCLSLAIPTRGRSLAATKSNI